MESCVQRFNLVRDFIQLKIDGVWLIFPFIAEIDAFCSNFTSGGETVMKRRDKNFDTKIIATYVWRSIVYWILTWRQSQNSNIWLSHQYNAIFFTFVLLVMMDEFKRRLKMTETSDDVQKSDSTEAWI